MFERTGLFPRPSRQPRLDREDQISQTERQLVQDFLFDTLVPSQVERAWSIRVEQAGLWPAMTSDERANRVALVLAEIDSLDDFLRL